MSRRVRHFERGDGRKWGGGVLKLAMDFRCSVAVGCDLDTASLL
jgi:hypothetical protein